MTNDYNLYIHIILTTYLLNVIINCFNMSVENGTDNLLKKSYLFSCMRDIEGRLYIGIQVHTPIKQKTVIENKIYYTK